MKKGTLDIFNSENGQGPYIDIVAVHGLASDPETTWTSRSVSRGNDITAPSHQPMWLRDFLSKEADLNARIMAFNHNTSWEAYALDKSLHDHGDDLLQALRVARQDEANTRPIVFIGHSFGGLIIKQALANASAHSADDFCRHLRQNARGFIFLGTPHRGARITLAGQILSLFGFWRGSSTSLLGIIKPGSAINQSMHDDFMRYLRGGGPGPTVESIVCVFEAVKESLWGWPIMHVVDKESAVIDGSHKLGFETDHRNIQRFSDKTDDNYQNTLHWIQKWAKKAEEEANDHDDAKARGKSREQQESLRSLHFPEMDQRKNDVQNAAADTCKWLLDHEKYSNWLAQPQALLWIVGKPGAGKSTLVKRALQERGHRNDVLASFFFFGQGCKLQKSSFGLFRSLLYKFLDQIPEMLSEFTSIYQKKQATQQKLGSDCEWQESELQDFLKDWIPRALMNRPIRVYVDALDECAPDDAKRLIAYFDELIEGLSSTRVGFKICFSCRHYPVLAPKGALRINVESGNNQDIATYVRHGLMKHGFPDTEPAQKLEQDIIRKASNVFQWAVLVIQIVIELEKNGASIRKIRQEIEKVPGDLKALYEHILSKIQDQKRAYQLMQWVCFADRPLSPKELRFAMAVDITNDFTSLEECQSSVDFAETDEQMEKQVNSLSAGLAETVEYDGRRIVRFMHQSVNDYLADGGLQKLDTSFFHDLMPNLKDSLSDKVAGLAHFRISRSCIKYINMKEFLSKIRGLSSLEAREFRLEKRKLMFDFPFLIYAAEWVSHARIVDTLRIPQDDLVRFFRWQPEDVAEFWGRYYDPAERNGKLVNGRRAKVTLLSIASEYGLLSVVEAIVEADENFDFDSRDCWGQTPLSLAARSGYEAIVRLLIGREDVEINSKDNSGRTPLLYAAQSGHEAVVRLLIGREDVEINLKDNLGRTPLSYAARSGHEAVVRLLIGREDVEINSKDNFEQTPLLHAARAGHEAVVRLLIGREDIEINSKDNLGQTPLSYAALSRHEAVVRLLIGREDVEINSKDRWGQTPLSHAAQSGHKAVVRLLIGREDIKINLKDNLGRTPLSYAAHSGHEAVVRLLIGREDVEINLRNRSGRTPLWYAAKDGHAAMVQILINRADVEIDSKDNDGSTPLSIADYYGHQNVVELLEREISQRQKLLEG